MLNKPILAIVICIFILSGCGTQEEKGNSLRKKLKSFDKELPTIGLLMYEGVLTTEVTAPVDVFTKLTQDKKRLFNVVTITENGETVVTEEGLEIMADYSFSNCPKLEVLFVPSAYDMSMQIKNNKIVNFIREKNKEAQFVVSNCSGAQLIGVSGIAKGKKIVTWVGGGKELKKDYPSLIVQDDTSVTYAEDGRFISSNGNLATYISSLELLEKMAGTKHRKFVESYLYLARLQNWKK